MKCCYKPTEVCKERNSIVPCTKCAYYPSMPEEPKGVAELLLDPGIGEQNSDEYKKWADNAIKVIKECVSEWDNNLSIPAKPKEHFNGVPKTVIAGIDFRTGIPTYAPVSEGLCSDYMYEAIQQHKQAEKGKQKHLKQITDVIKFCFPMAFPEEIEEKVNSYYSYLKYKNDDKKTD